MGSWASQNEASSKYLQSRQLALCPSWYNLRHFWVLSEITGKHMDSSPKPRGGTCQRRTCRVPGFIIWHQPKQCMMITEIPQDHHTLFDSPKMGNFMIPVRPTFLEPSAGSSLGQAKAILNPDPTTKKHGKPGVKNCWYMEYSKQWPCYNRLGPIHNWDLFTKFSSHKHFWGTHSCSGHSKHLHGLFQSIFQ